jgi:hypothetical protein
MNKIINKLLYLLFGEWNGVQVFVVPTTFLFVLDQYSFVNWITSVLSMQRYFIPLMIYSVLLFSVIFLCTKVYVHWKSDKSPQKPGASVSLWRDLMIPFFIKLNKWLLAFLVLIVLIFMFKSGFVFIYKKGFPIFIVLHWFVRIWAILMSLYIYQLLRIAIPIIKRGRSLYQAQRYFHLLIIKRWKSAIPILIVQLLWIYVSILLFSLAIGQIERFNEIGLFADNGKPLFLIFTLLESKAGCLGNMSLLLLAFLFSNLLYSPFVYLVNLGLKRFNLHLGNI